MSVPISRISWAIVGKKYNFYKFSLFPGRNERGIISYRIIIHSLIENVL